MIKDIIIARLKEIAKYENNFDPRTTKWKHFNINGMHLSSFVKRFDSMPDRELVSLFEKVIRQSSKQM